MHLVNNGLPNASSQQLETRNVPELVASNEISLSLLLLLLPGHPSPRVDAEERKQMLCKL